MKVITVYELIGMLKDGKAPKKIKINENILNLEIGEETFYKFDDFGSLSFDYYIMTNKLNEKVEIIDKINKMEDKRER